MDLYENYHPNKSLKGTGFKNKEKAKNTIKLIKYRSLKYQFDVINTMYNRAKFHPNQTKEMRDAMNIFKNWLKKYKERKEKEEKEYPILPFDVVKKYAEKYQIENDFYNILKKYKGKIYKLQYIPIGKYDYFSMRNKYIKDNKNIKYFKKNGEPTKKHLNLILYSFSPYIQNGK